MPSVRLLLLLPILLPFAAACSSSPATTPPSHDGGSADTGSHHTSDAQSEDAKKHVDAKAPASDASDSGLTGPTTASPGSPPLLGVDCDPMVPGACGYPFPSNVWTTPDTTQSTGMHVYFGPTTLPVTQKGMKMGTAPFETRDGFSQGTTILTLLPGATATGLPGQDSLATSVTTSSATILMNADTGELIPHFSEIDIRTTITTEQSFMIQPMIRLDDATRYIVAIRHVVDANNDVLPANPVFAALRDGTPSDIIYIKNRATLYADIMNRLKTHGIDTTDLQLAWDFTTASKANTTQWMTTIRDDALAKVGDAGPPYTITNVAMNPDPNIYERLTGTMTVPYYLTTTNIPSSINFNDAGVPTQNGTADFPFIVEIPNSIVNGDKPAGPIIINAHGLLGVETEGEDSYLADICNREGYVAVAVQLIGMDSDDINFVGAVVSGEMYDLSQFEMAVEMQHQGLLNELLAIRMMIGGLSKDQTNTYVNGNPTIDPTQSYYRGDSQGGIFGGTFMALSTDVTRGMLGEPGAPYSLLLDRSSDFGIFFGALQANFGSPIDVQFAIVLMDQLWFRTEPGGYIPYITTNLLPNTPSHSVLIEANIGDQQVTPLGAELIARTVGAQNLQKVNREVYGVSDSASGFSGSGLVEWAYGLPPAPLTDTPPTAGPDPHEELRYVPAEEDQADQFFRTGFVNQTCPDGGPCMVFCGDAGPPSCTTTPP